MFWGDFYKGKTEKEIAKAIEKDGFQPLIISDAKGFVYHKHQHPQTKLLVFLKGSMEVSVCGKTYACKPFDKLIIPGNTPHMAVVGNSGCTFFWSEKTV